MPLKGKLCRQIIILEQIWQRIRCLSKRGAKYFVYRRAILSHRRESMQRVAEDLPCGERWERRLWRKKRPKRVAAVCVQRSRIVGEAHAGHRNRASDSPDGSRGKRIEVFAILYFSRFPLKKPLDAVLLVQKDPGTDRSGIRLFTKFFGAVVGGNNGIHGAAAEAAFLQSGYAGDGRAAGGADRVLQLAGVLPGFQCQLCRA